MFNLLSISPTVLEYIGYIASLIVLISLLMSSIKKLRWINLFGSLLFGAYGFLIGSVPTGLMNVGIALINIFYLVKIYGSKEYFKLLPINPDSNYLKAFFDFYKDDINDYKDVQYNTLKTADMKLLILRDMAPAGLFMADKVEDYKAEVILDYAIPMYRDFKLGSYLFIKNKHLFKAQNIKVITTHTTVQEHINYLRKMGFELVDKKTHQYELVL